MSIKGAGLTQEALISDAGIDRLLVKNVDILFPFCKTARNPVSVCWFLTV